MLRFGMASMPPLPMDDKATDSVCTVERNATVVRVPPDHVHVLARLGRRVRRQRCTGRRQLRGLLLARTIVASQVHVVAWHGRVGW